MRQLKLTLSITLGLAFVAGLFLALNFSAVPAQAKSGPAPAAPTLDHSDAITDALAYLQNRQLPNGGIEGDWTPDTVDDFTTIKAVIAVAAADRPINFMTSVSDATPLDYLATQAVTYMHDITGTLFPGRAGMLAVAVVAGDGSPYNFGGMNIVNQLTSTYRADSGAYSTTAKGLYSSGAANASNQLWAILGLAAAQETIPVTATDFLISLQEGDGSGGWGYGSGGDVDTTALVLQSLIASGNVAPTHAKVQEGLGFLRNAQVDSGGWESWGSLSADSTAAVIQAAVAAGYTPATKSWAAANGTPHDALTSLQAGDGSFSGNALGTAHAIAGLVEAPLPVLGRTQRANRALTWMNEQQNGDGSWSFFGAPDPGATCDAVLAYAAAGFDPDSVTASDSVTSALDYLSATASSYVTQSSDSAGKLALAVEAASGDAHNFGGENVINVITNTWYSPTLGAFGVPTNTWHQAWAMLGLAAAGESVPVSATQTLTGLQQSDGGWKYDLSQAWWNTTGPDNTGLALQALIAAGVPATDTSVVSGVLFLQDQQNDQGSWSSGGSSSANSTAYAMQGLLAVGEVLTADKWLKGGHSPYNALASLQKSDGPFAQAEDDDTLATLQAVPALLGVHHPFTHALKPFAVVQCGPDPDRMVIAPPRVTWGNSVDVIVPFGSDLNGDSKIELKWRSIDSSTWITDTIHRADGYYTATLPITTLATYDFAFTFSDSDKIQTTSDLTDTITQNIALEPHIVYLPLVVKH